MYRNKSLFLLIFASILSVSCSGGGGSEPTDEEILRAMHGAFDKAIAQILELADDASADMVPELHATKKIACSKAKESNGYNCDVEIDLTTAFDGRQKTIKTIRFVKAEDEWVAIEQ